MNRCLRSAHVFGRCSGECRVETSPHHNQPRPWRRRSPPERYLFVLFIYLLMKRKAYESSDIMVRPSARTLVWKEAKQQAKVRVPESFDAPVASPFAGLVEEFPTERERELARLCDRGRHHIAELQTTVDSLSKRLEDMAKVNIALLQNQQHTLAELDLAQRKVDALIDQNISLRKKYDLWSPVYDELSPS